MSATNNFETSLLKMIFNNDSIAGIADGLGSPGELYLSLHVADPGEGGDQTTSEANYTSYTRIGLTRDGTNWIVTNNQVTNGVVVSFPLATGGSSLITDWGIGTAPAGTGTLLIKGTLDAPLAVSAGIRPIFDIGDLVIEID